MILGKSAIKIIHFLMISFKKFKGLGDNVFFLFNNGQDTVAQCTYAIDPYTVLLFRAGYLFTVYNLYNI